jgi:hypothetical protein
VLARCTPLVVIDHHTLCAAAGPVLVTCQGETKKAERAPLIHVLHAAVFPRRRLGCIVGRFRVLVGDRRAGLARLMVRRRTDGKRPATVASGGPGLRLDLGQDLLAEMLEVVERPTPAGFRGAARAAASSFRAPGSASGATSQPKGVVLTQANYRTITESMSAAVDLGPDHRWLGEAMEDLPDLEHGHAGDERTRVLGGHDGYPHSERREDPIQDSGCSGTGRQHVGEDAEVPLTTPPAPVADHVKAPPGPRDGDVQQVGLLGGPPAGALCF